MGSEGEEGMAHFLWCSPCAVSTLFRMVAEDCIVQLLLTGSVTILFRELNLGSVYFIFPLHISFNLLVLNNTFLKN